MEKRESKFELLRIILILMVIGLHYFNGSMGGLLSNVDKFSVNYYLANFIESAFIIAVNVFIIITGYFMINKNEISVKKVYHLLSICIFYGIVIFVILLAIGKIQLNLSSIKNLIYTIDNRWFIVIYCILYLLIPFINKLLKSISKKQFQMLLGILIFFFSIWPTFFTNITVNDNGYGIINFIILYLIGGYIKLYKDDKKYSSISYIIYIVCTIITTFISIYKNRTWMDI